MHNHLLDSPPTLRSYAEYLAWLATLLPGSGEPAPCADGASRSWPRWQPGERIRPWPAGPELVVVPAGSVRMGAHPLDPDAHSAEHPAREVSLPRPLAIGRAPVTFDEWEACLADGGTRHRPVDATWGRKDRPVIHVSWHDAEEYLGWLSRKTGLRFRLLSEAEWEYACWAGQPQQERYPWGGDLGFRQLRHHAWYRDNAGHRTQPVGQLQPNAWGLVDMLGNVAEWVADAWHPDLSQTPTDAAPHTTPHRRSSRVFKGGSWLDAPLAVRPSARHHVNPDHRSYRVGFRVAMELPA